MEQYYEAKRISRISLEVDINNILYCPKFRNLLQYNLYCTRLFLIFMIYKPEHYKFTEWPSGAS